MGNEDGAAVVENLYAGVIKNFFVKQADQVVAELGVFSRPVVGVEAFYLVEICFFDDEIGRWKIGDETRTGDFVAVGAGTAGAEPGRPDESGGLLVRVVLGRS